ncbi:MAG: hypothetical protein IKC31_00710 [Clostridia bacterium]|nr:hypothetical protein [Clostridia bacterium]
MGGIAIERRLRQNAESQILRALENRRMQKHRFFLGYQWDLFRRGELYRGWRTFLSYLRRFRMLAWIVQGISVLFALLQTGTLVLLWVALILILLPVLLLLLIVLPIIALVESRRTDRLLSGELQKKHVYILFLPNGDDAFCRETARMLVQDESAAVLLISPFFLSAKKGASRRFYLTARKEAHSVFLVRKYYLFHLRRALLKDIPCTYLY